MHNSDSFNSVIRKSILIFLIFDLKISKGVLNINFHVQYYQSNKATRDYCVNLRYLLFLEGNVWDRRSNRRSWPSRISGT